MPWPVPNRPPCSTASSTPRTDSTTPARRTAPTEATLGPAGTPRPENPTPRQPTIHTHQRNEDPETPRYSPGIGAAIRRKSRTVLLAVPHGRELDPELSQPFRGDDLLLTSAVVSDDHIVESGEEGVGT